VDLAKKKKMVKEVGTVETGGEKERQREGRGREREREDFTWGFG
jgi:hypothetical protein